MEYPKDLLEEQKALLLDDLKFSDGVERIQDLKRLKEVNDALLILNGVVSTCCDETKKVNQFLKRPSKYCMTCSKELK